MKIEVSQPNPYGHEWMAIDSDTYDASWEGDEDGWVSSSPVGWGKTREAASDDLMEQLKERET